MNSLKCLLCLFCFCMIVCEPGCVVISGEPHVYEEIEIDVAPPPPPEVVIVTRPRRPSRIHVWIDGHYVVRLGSWVWIEGHWAEPEHRGAKWVPPHTRRKGNRWGYRPGHWR